jgi:hypothetical protein
MELHPYLHYLVHRERAADAMRNAERWRLIKSLKVQGSSPGWLERLGARRLVPVHPLDEAGKPRAGARQTASSPTH